MITGTPFFKFSNLIDGWDSKTLLREISFIVFERQYFPELYHKIVRKLN